MFVRISPPSPDFKPVGAPPTGLSGADARRGLFDAVRVRSYLLRPRHSNRTLWELCVLQLARTVNTELQLGIRDGEVRRLAARHAGWCWRKLRHFEVYRHDDPGMQAWKGRLSGKSRRGMVRLRDRLVVAFLTDHPGTTFTAVARAVGISRTQVMRVVRRDAPELYRSIRTRFLSAAARVGNSAPGRLLAALRRRLRKSDRKGEAHLPGQLISTNSQCQPRAGGDIAGLAETEGFEPSRRFPVYSLSRGAPSTTRPRLRGH